MVQHKPRLYIKNINGWSYFPGSLHYVARTLNIIPCTDTTTLSSVDGFLRRNETVR